MPSNTLDEPKLKRALNECPRLASLRSINDALHELMHAEQTPAGRIADLIRKDPALTTRLLKLTNSAFFGLSQAVTSIEDAVLLLGTRQIRELALATPVIEEFEALKKIHNKVNWTSLWQHSVGSAIITREILSIAQVSTKGDVSYIAGLVHNIGKIVIAYVFPEEFHSLIETKATTPEVFCKKERELLGWDHAQIGAYHLARNELPKEVVEAVRFHHNPIDAPEHAPISAALQIADYMLRFGGIEYIENIDPIEQDSWKKLEAWRILFGEEEEESHNPRLDALEQSLNILPEMLHEMV